MTPQFKQRKERSTVDIVTYFCIQVSVEYSNKLKLSDRFYKKHLNQEDHQKSFHQQRRNLFIIKTQK
jgi:hypothetical protein